MLCITLLRSGRRCLSWFLYVAMVMGMKLGNGLTWNTALQSHKELYIDYQTRLNCVCGIPHLVHALICEMKLVKGWREVSWLTHKVLLQNRKIRKFTRKVTIKRTHWLFSKSHLLEGCHSARDPQLVRTGPPSGWAGWTQQLPISTHQSNEGSTGLSSNLTKSLGGGLILLS